MENSDLTFEQGPIRPPSEAESLLIRVTRNCPWNRCAFCHLYKGSRFSPRSVEEVKSDIDAVRTIAEEIQSLSRQIGSGGEVTQKVARKILENPDLAYPYKYVAIWLYRGGKTAFLQDANTMVLKTGKLAEILKYLKKTFPSLERITSYSRSQTIARKTVQELKTLRSAGLNRLHVGFESGYDPLLTLVKKGTTAEEHTVAGRRVVESGIELTEYYMPGLGGRDMSENHAIASARVLSEINPTFIRLRTSVFLPGMPLADEIEKKTFIPLDDDETVMELRLFLEGLNDISSTVLSDHIINLLPQVEGTLPEDKGAMLQVIDDYLSLDPETRILYRAGRRAGFLTSPAQLSHPVYLQKVQDLLAALEGKFGSTEEGLSRLLGSYI